MICRETSIGGVNDFKCFIHTTTLKETAGSPIFFRLKKIQTYILNKMSQEEEPDGARWRPARTTPGVGLWLQGQGPFQGDMQGRSTSAEQAVSSSSWLGVRQQGMG